MGLAGCTACAERQSENSTREETSPEYESADMAPDVASDMREHVRPEPDAQEDAKEPEPDMKVEASEPGLVRLQTGTLRGVVRDGVAEFRGVPYAAAPVGSLRWKPPAPAAPWEGELVADSWPAKCLQYDQSEQRAVGAEDCLYLNVWAPVDVEDAPVMVFIHGGGNLSGSTSEGSGGVETYHGERLARATGAIVVTLQYRLNAMGYLSTPELDAEVDGGHAGNWGLRDQVAGLEWVAEHISAFGGDRTKRLLFGESGGAADVCALVGSSMAAGLFEAAIVQSGGCGAKPIEEVRRWSDAVAEAVGCGSSQDRLACLRAADPHELATASSLPPTDQGAITIVGAGPAVDGVVLERPAIESIAMGVHNKVPIVFGVTEHETASPLFGLLGEPWTKERFEERVRALFGADADAVLEQYDVEGGGFFNHAEAMIALTTDSQFICPNRTFARITARNQDEPVYRFLFSHAISAGPARFLGAFHGLELVYNFQHIDEYEDYEATSDDRYVEDVLATLWSDFARKPAGTKVYNDVTWEPYDPDRDNYLHIQSPLALRDGMRTTRCDFWESIWYD